MKNIYIILTAIFSFCTLNLSAQDIADLETFEKAMKPGAEITYNVTTKGQQFKLVITLKEVGDEISYSWKTSEPDNKSGSVTMNRNAVAQAKAFAHIFSGGNTTLDKETSLWISKQVFTDINTNALASLKINGASDTVTVMTNAVDNFGFTVNGNIIGLETWELQGGNPKYIIGVIESQRFPIIYKLDIGWTLVLTEIKDP